MKSSAKGMVMFRNAFKGYDKNDVNRYIEDMNIRFSTAEQRYISTIRMLENDVEKAREDAAKAKEAQNLKDELEVVKASLEEKQAQIDALNEELVKRPECSCANDEKREVTLEEAESKLGSIIVKANLDAQNILSDAEEQRAKIISEAEKTAEGIRFDAAVKARLMTDNAKKDLAALSEEFINTLSSISEESAGEYRRICDEMKVKLTAAELLAKAKIKE